MMASDEAGTYDVVIIGAGASGLAIAHHLLRRKITNFVILDRGDGVGGVWRDNHYPGAGCDVPSHLYSFSFAPKPDWSRKFASRDEILAYFEASADRLGLRDQLRPGTGVSALTYERGAGCWRVALQNGRQLRTRAVVSAVGQLSDPHIPQIDGLDTFAGPVVHTAAWDDTLDLDTKRVSVIGNAASAIQLLPIIAARAGHVDNFQRTPNWVIPKPDRAFTAFELFLFRHLPGYRWLYRTGSFLIHESRFAAFRSGGLASAYTRWRLNVLLRKAVRDPALRAKLTPDYAPGCKRILLSNTYFETLQRPDVALHTDGIARVTPEGLVTGRGLSVPADVLILATGFKASEFLSTLTVTGPDGRTLSQSWDGSPSAYRGVAVSGFPNLFLMYGPNTNLGHNSIIFMAERQAEYIARKIARLLGRGLRSMNVKAEAEQAFNARVQAELARTVWAGDCPSWYKNRAGLITNNWSGLASGFALALWRSDDQAWEEAS